MANEGAIVYAKVALLLRFGYRPKERIMTHSLDIRSTSGSRFASTCFQLEPRSPLLLHRITLTLTWNGFKFRILCYATLLLSYSSRASLIIYLFVEPAVFLSLYITPKPCYPML